VTCQSKINFNKSFSDEKFGFAFYGKGSLRNGSAMSGETYGYQLIN
jgi:hypothetical protein